MILQIIVTDNYIYIRDNYDSGSVAIYTSSGKFVKRLQKGQGPGEFGSACYFYFNRSERSFFVSDIFMAKIVKYSESGKYIKELHYNSNILREDFAIGNGNIFSIKRHFQNPEGQFLLYSSDLSFDNCHCWKLGKDRCMLLGKPYLQDYCEGQNVYVDNVAYHLKENKMTRKYIIKDDSNIDIDKEGGFVHDIHQMSLSDNQDKYIFSGKIFETIEYHLLGFVSGERFMTIFRNKITGKAWQVNRDVLSLSKYITVCGIHSDRSSYFVGIVKVESLLGMSPSGNDSRWDGTNPNNLISPSDMQKLRNLKEDDNPVIVLFKLKSE